MLESVFTFTADQEKAHAKVFYNLLEQVSGQSLQVDGTYPVELFPDILDHLRSAQHNEYQEYSHDYAGFENAAPGGGFPEIAHIFTMIAGIEKIHGDRFGSSPADGAGQALCLRRGGEVDVPQLRPGDGCHHAPALCPVCRHPQGFFIRLEMAPFQ